MKLIREDIDFSEMEVITEEVNGKKSLHITGPFLQAEKVNRNGRVYPQRVMDGAVQKYIKEYVKKNRALGELNHPAEPIVNPERAAIMTKSLRKEGNFYVGKAKVLSTPMGQIVENLLDDGVTIGVSSRGLGSLKASNGINEVQEDFMLTTAADVVFDPSAQTAFVEGVYEAKEWIMESGSLRSIDMEQQRERLIKAKAAELRETKLALFENFLRNIEINK
ncbi:MAG: primosomal protein [Candidatus Thiodiazotropha taylori]|uniref:Primosomal protein n=1 Tax=Candidatus Thiodiazotropha taylori TaxID=2792791 RepID=A0A9E4K9G1_9GAMM|nr:primosomal protein [Candidatus Thiodiazotropha taylori]MCW4255060.1 primosomal protein [Candidatus Thiodiazotropha taylori]